MAEASSEQKSSQTTEEEIIRIKLKRAGGRLTYESMLQKNLIVPMTDNVPDQQIMMNAIDLPTSGNSLALKPAIRCAVAGCLAEVGDLFNGPEHGPLDMDTKKSLVDLRGLCFLKMLGVQKKNEKTILLIRTCEEKEEPNIHGTRYTCLLELFYCMCFRIMHFAKLMCEIQFDDSKKEVRVHVRNMCMSITEFLLASGAERSGAFIKMIWCTGRLKEKFVEIECKCHQTERMEEGDPDTPAFHGQNCIYEQSELMEVMKALVHVLETAQLYGDASVQGRSLLYRDLEHYAVLATLCSGGILITAQDLRKY